MKVICNTPDCIYCDDEDGICLRDKATIYNGECVSIKEREDDYDN